MVWLIEGFAMKRLARNTGWRRVVLSQRVWEECVVVPEEVKSQSEDLRIWDLLIFLGDALGPAPATSHRLGNRVGFIASVVNDDRDECDDIDGRNFPTATRFLEARAVFAEDGSPCLVVTLPQEDCSL